MDIYRALGTEPPTIVYCVLHQAGGQVPEEHYDEGIAGLHRAVRQATAEALERYQAWMAEIVEEKSKEEAEKLAASLPGIEKGVLQGKLQERLKRTSRRSSQDRATWG